VYNSIRNLTQGIAVKNFSLINRISSSLPQRDDSVSLCRLPAGEERSDDTVKDTVEISKKAVTSNLPDENKEIDPDDSSDKPDKKWTIMMYAAADNNLEQYIVNNVIDIEKTSFPDDVDFVVQLDRGEEPSELSEGWKGARRLKLEESINPQTIDSPVLEDMGQVNMANPENLKDFIEWATKNHPAENYMLIVSSHGKGWMGAVDDSDSKGLMSLEDMKNAIADARENTGEKLDIIAFDSCLMAQAEVAYGLRGQADYLVASQEIIGGKGWPYDKILPGINKEPEEVIETIVQSSASTPYTTPTMSAVDLGQMDNVASKTKELTASLMNTKASKILIGKNIDRSQSFGNDRYYRDFFSFCRGLETSEKLKDKTVKPAAQETMKALKKAVIHEKHSSEYPHVHGLSINMKSYTSIPTEKDLLKEYNKTEFAQDTNWNQVVENSSGHNKDILGYLLYKMASR
jgi:hypothetical protein